MIQNKQENKFNADRIEITYYTDPLCCWSWALEPQWRKLLFEFRDDISWKYVMGGLIPDWKSYNDPLNSVSRPVQMGPLWIESQYLSGMAVNERIWIENPPVSSYPACIAFKCAEMQSAKAAEIYLRYLREAAIIQAKNIAELGVLKEIAERVVKESPGLLDTGKFSAALTGEEGKNAFREDLQKVRFNKIGRFPTIAIVKAGKGGLLLTGYRPYEALKEALTKVAPELKDRPDSYNPREFASFWEFPLTARELQEVH